jgi:hypothetical protein
MNEQVHTEYDKYAEHVGHDIEIVMYGAGENVAIECMDCYVIIASEDLTP